VVNQQAVPESNDPGGKYRSWKGDQGKIAPNVLQRDFTATHEVICADLSLNNVTDAEVFPGLMRQTHRKIRVDSADGAYDTKRCHDELRRKKIRALIPPRTRAGYWSSEYADRNQAVGRQRLTGSNACRKWKTAYNRCPVFI